MSVSAAHFKEVTNGYEKRSDGLWVHKGRLSVGPPGIGTNYGPAVAGDINANRGNGTGAYFFAGLDKYVFYDGANFQFNPLLSSAALAAGASQANTGGYNTGTAFSTSTTGQWLATPVSTGSIACSGALCRIEASTLMYHSTLNAAWYTGLMVDGVLVFNMSLTYCYVVGAAQTVSWTVYYVPTVANHTFVITAHNATAGTLTMHPGVSSSIYVTEQRR